MRLAMLYAALYPLLTESRLLENVSQNDFDDLLRGNDLLVAIFSSQSFDPVQPFHRVLRETSESTETPMILIDCDVQADLCKEYDINEYPAIRVYKRKTDEEFEMKRYRGKRTKTAIKSFITRHQLPTLSRINPTDLANFKKIDSVVIIAYLPLDDQDRLELFRSFAERRHDEYVFGYVTDPDAAKAENVEVTSIVCYKNIDNDHKVLKGLFHRADVETFLRTATRTLIGEFNERNIDLYMAPAKLAVYIFTTTEDEANALRYELTPIASQLEQYVTFGVVDGVEYGPMAQGFGLFHDTFPALAIHAPLNDHVFTYLQGRKIIASAVEAMLMSILQGKATSGQVFGGEAPELDEDTRDVRHNEL